MDGVRSTVAHRDGIGFLLKESARILVLVLMFFLASLRVASAQGAVCAEVKIEIKQTVSLERQAFDAVLRIRNGLDTFAVQQIDVNVLFWDENGAVPVNGAPGAKFFVREDGQSGMTGSGNGNWSVPPNTVGEASWLIIPAAGAGGNSPSGMQYLVGASISYVIDGELRTIDVIPETITVRPQPMLVLDYFLPGTVYGADPLTGSGTEEPVPFTLGVRVRNIGAGPASRVKIESAQPEVTLNDQGLLIHFQILDSHVDEQPAQPTLTIDFGDIPPDVTRMGRWSMTSSLSGTFDDFQAYYTHADELGGALTSLIVGEPMPHTLVKDVLVDLDGHDSIRDFLARDVNILRAYVSSGEHFEVDEPGATLTGPPSQRTLSLNAFPSAFGYAKVIDPNAGTNTSVSAVRSSDGKVLHQANVWLSKERNANLDWEYFINLFDTRTAGSSSSEIYTLTFDDAPPASNAAINGFVYEDLNANGLHDSDEPNLSGVDVHLSRTDAGGTLEISAPTDAAGAFRFSVLPAGTYAVRVAEMAGYTNGVHQAGTSGGITLADGIGEIVLSAGTQASGYLLAKSQTVVQPSTADLEISALTASTTTPMQEDAFILSTAVRNNGPATVSAVVQLGLPFAMEILSTPLPEFDAATGIWTVGTLQPGAQVVLTLDVRMLETGQAFVSAAVTSASPQILDPVPGNNEQILELDVEPKQITLDLVPGREPRVLGLAGCEGQTGGGVPTTCVADRVNQLSNRLESLGVDRRVVTSADEFVVEMRSGHWNTYWISGGADALDVEDVVRELQLASLRGESIIIDGERGSGSVWLEEPAALYSGDISALDRLVTIPAAGVFISAQFTAPGRSRCYGPSSVDVQALGEIAGTGCPAVLHGGSTLVFAFDLLAAVEAAPAVLEPFVAHFLAAIQPATPETLIGESFTSVRARMRNPFADLADPGIIYPDGQATLTVTLPVEARWLTSIPSVDDPEASAPAWTLFLGPMGFFESIVGLELPAAGGTYSFAADLTQDDGRNLVLLAEASFLLNVRDFASHITLTRSALETEPMDSMLRDEALVDFDAAVAARAAGRPDDALAAAKRVAIVFDPSHGGAPGLREDFGWFLYGVQREWTRSLPQCPSGSSQSLDFASGTSFTEIVGSPVANAGKGDNGTIDLWLFRSSSTGAGMISYVSIPWVQNELEWGLFYDGAGGATLGVRYLDDISWSGIEIEAAVDSVAPGNALRFRAELNGSDPSSSIEVTVDEINSTVVSGTIVATGGQGASQDEIFIHGAALRHGFSAGGTLSVTGRMLAESISFSVTSGSMSCQRAEP